MLCRDTSDWCLENIDYLIKFENKDSWFTNQFNQIEDIVSTSR